MKPTFIDLKQFNALIKNKPYTLIENIYPVYIGYPIDDLSNGLSKYLDELLNDWGDRNEECDECLEITDQKYIREMLNNVVKENIKTLYVILKDILPDSTKNDITFGMIIYLTTLSHQIVTNIENLKIDYPGYTRTGLKSGFYLYDINFLLYGESSTIKIYDNFITSYIECDD